MFILIRIISFAGSPSERIDENELRNFDKTTLQNEECYYFFQLPWKQQGQLWYDHYPFYSLLIFIYFFNYDYVEVLDVCFTPRCFESLQARN